MNANKLSIHYNTRLCQCQIELKKLIRVFGFTWWFGSRMTYHRRAVVQHNYYLNLMFINRFQAVEASIRRVHATLQPSRVQEYLSSSMRPYTVGDSQVRIQK